MQLYTHIGECVCVCVCVCDVYCVPFILLSICTWVWMYTWLIYRNTPDSCQGLAREMLLLVRSGCSGAQGNAFFSCWIRWVYAQSGSWWSVCFTRGEIDITDIHRYPVSFHIEYIDIFGQEWIRTNKWRCFFSCTFQIFAFHGGSSPVVQAKILLLWLRQKLGRTFRNHLVPAQFPGFKVHCRFIYESLKCW